MLVYAFRIPLYNAILDSESKNIEAVIIDNKNILSNSAIDPEFTYSYQFYIKGNTYIGNSRDTKYKVGNRIKVEYWPRWPFVNRAINYK